MPFRGCHSRRDEAGGERRIFVMKDWVKRVCIRVEGNSLYMDDVHHTDLCPGSTSTGRE
jgi:hypothetical protein